VNDDFDVWMPISSSGCDVIRQVLAAADDVILDTTLLFFQYAARECLLHSSVWVLFKFLQGLASFCWFQCLETVAVQLPDVSKLQKIC
jgi:hypothetical protein